MAGKTIETKTPISFDALKAIVEEKLSAVLFEHPEGYGEFELTRLKRYERKAIQDATRRADGTVDVELQNRMAAAYGIYSPWLVDEPNDKKRAERTIEALKEYPDDLIEPIAEKVWEISNSYRDTEPNGKGGGEPAPFSRRSSRNGDSATPSDGPSPKSAP